MKRRMFFNVFGSGAVAVATGNLGGAVKATAATVEAPAVAAAGTLSPLLLGVIKKMITKYDYAFVSKYDVEHVTNKIMKIFVEFSGGYPEKSTHWIHLDSFLGGDQRELLLADPASATDYAESLLPKFISHRDAGRTSETVHGLLPTFEKNSPARWRELRRVERLLNILVKIGERHVDRSIVIPPHILSMFPKYEDIPLNPKRIAAYARALRKAKRAEVEYASARENAVRPMMQRFRKLFYKVNSEEISNKKFRENHETLWVHREVRRRLRWTQHTRDRRKPKILKHAEDLKTIKQCVLRALSEHVASDRFDESDVCLRVVSRIEVKIKIQEAGLTVMPDFDLDEVFDETFWTWKNLRSKFTIMVKSDA